MNKLKALSFSCVCLAVLAAPITGSWAEDPRAERDAGSFSLDSSFELELPKGWNLQETAGVVVNEKGHIFVFHRGDHQLLEFDHDGKFVREIGAGLFKKPHGLRLDRDGNLWTTDLETHVVLKFDRRGRVAMVLGRMNFPGTGKYNNDWNLTLLKSPSDVGFDTDGNIYVTDRGNERIVKFSASGALLATWGEKGTAPGQFNHPHSIVVDKANRLIVADRDNKRIQIFSAEGDFIEERTDVGYPYILQLDEDENLWVTNARFENVSQYNSEGDLIRRYHAAGKLASQFDSVHGIALDGPSHILVTEIFNWRVQRFLVSR